MSIYTNIHHHYDRLFPLDTKKLHFVLEEETPQKILDIGCATGALCHELFRRGHDVVGIDMDKAIIDQARGKTAQGPRFEVMDMVAIDQHFDADSFDQILCFDNTLSHLPNEMAVKKFFIAMEKILAPGGKFKCALVNYDQAMEKGMLNLPPIQVGDILLKRHQSMEQQFMACYTELVEGTERKINCVPLFPIRSSQVEELLREVGFNHITLYCDYERCTLSGDHYYNVLEAWR